MSYYGIDTTDDVELDGMGLPVGTYKAMATDEQPDDEARGVIVTWEAVDGEHKGKSGRAWYLTTHDNKQTADIARQNLRRIADATGKPISESAPIKGRVCTLIVDRQKKNPQYTEIKKYLPEDYKSAGDDEPPM